MNAGVGIRDHSGWAIAVVLAGPVEAPEIVERRRIVLCDPDLPRQPYHQSEHAAMDMAREVVRKVEESARRNGAAEIRLVLARAKLAGAEIRAAGVGGKPQPLPPFEKIVKSHALLHAAEGELYREMLAIAAEDCGLKVWRFVPKDVFAVTADELGMEEGFVRERVLAMGKALGPPWTADHKEATAAAWLALSRSGERR